MYTRFSRRLYQAYVSSSCSCRSRYVSPLSSSCQRFLDITFNRPSAGNLTRTLYTWNIFYRETDSATLCKNGMESMESSQQNEFKLNYEQLLEKKKDSQILIVDIREPSELRETGKLPGSIHIPMDNVKNVFKNFSEKEFQEKYGKPKPTKDTQIIFSCRSGGRSNRMQITMQKLGYTQVYDYTGGWLDWQKNSEKEK